MGLNLVASVVSLIPGYVRIVRYVSSRGYSGGVSKTCGIIWNRLLWLKHKLSPSLKFYLTQRLFMVNGTSFPMKMSPMSCPSLSSQVPPFVWSVCKSDGPASSCLCWCCRWKYIRCNQIGKTPPSSGLFCSESEGSLSVFKRGVTQSVALETTKIDGHCPVWID